MSGLGEGFGRGVQSKPETAGRPAAGKKRVALKYCGGCDPEFDRPGYFARIREAAGDSIEWVTLDEVHSGTVLLINGCSTACPEYTADFSACERIVSIRDDKPDPREIVETLLQ